MRNEGLLLGFLCLLGCSSEDEPKTRTREEFCREWANQACSTEVVQRCQASSVEACRTSQQAFCSNLVPQSFSGESSDACLAAVGRAYSDGDLTSSELKTVLRLDAPCDQLVRGPKGRGESCSSNRDCNAPGGFDCVKKGGAVMGVCEIPELVGAGLKCNAAQQVCGEGFYCNGDNCIAAKDPGDSCTSHEECGVEAYCGDAGTCVARATVNTACTEDLECRSEICYEYSAADQTCTDRLSLGRNDPLCAQLR